MHVESLRQVLCASNAAHDQVDPVDPPEGAAVGERVTFQGFEGAPEPVLNPKKKVFEKLAPDLQTDDSARPHPAPEICSSCHMMSRCMRSDLILRAKQHPAAAAPLPCFQGLAVHYSAMCYLRLLGMTSVQCIGCWG